jgi:hypothetical protein
MRAGHDIAIEVKLDAGVPIDGLKSPVLRRLFPFLLPGSRSDASFVTKSL